MLRRPLDAALASALLRWCQSTGAGGVAQCTPALALGRRKSLALSLLAGDAALSVGGLNCKRGGGAAAVEVEVGGEV